MISAKRIVSAITVAALAVTMCCIPIMADETYAAAPPATFAGNKIIAPTTVYVGQTFTVTLEGSNQNLTSPVDGDTRYIPWAYDFSGPNYFYDGNIFVRSPYSKVFTLNTPGTYTFTAEYSLERWTDYGFLGDDWAHQSSFVKRTVTINVIEPQAPAPTVSKYRITLNGNKGKMGKKKTKYKTVTQRNKYGKLPKVKRKNYMFKGWYTKKKGGSKITASTKVNRARKHTLYAQWIGPKGKGKTISKKEYKRIKTGMTYKQVKFIIGGSAKSDSSASSGRYTLKMYSWKGNGSLGSNAVVSFRNGKVSGKAQTGLK